MTSEQFAGGEEAFLRRYDYDDRWIIAADLDVDDEHIDVDVVGDTAIVVVDNADRVREMEVQLPAPEAEVTTNNGVLTIELSK